MTIEDQVLVEIDGTLHLGIITEITTTKTRTTNTTTASVSLYNKDGIETIVPVRDEGIDHIPLTYASDVIRFIEQTAGYKWLNPPPVPATEKTITHDPLIDDPI